LEDRKRTSPGGSRPAPHVKVIDIASRWLSRLYRTTWGDSLMRLATIRRLSMALALAGISSAASGDPVAPADIYVVDGDTIDVHGQRIRLIDFEIAVMPSPFNVIHSPHYVR
jgi:hypothetical protein